MIVTDGAFAAGLLAVVEGPEALFAQPAIVVAARMAAATAVSRVLFTDGSPSTRGLRWDVPGSLDGGTSVVLRGTPAEQPVLQNRDEGLRDQGDDRHEDHSGEDAVHVEVVL
jgi:hypothetical protein